LSEGDATFRALIEPFAEAIWEADVDESVIVDWQSLRSFLSQTMDKFYGEGWVDSIDPDDQAYLVRQWQEVIHTGSVVDVQLRFKSADGSWHWTRIRAIASRNSNGEVEKWVGFNLDITERKRELQQLANSNQRLNEVLASIQDVFYVLDRDWNFVYVNSHFSSRAGMEPEDLIGNNIWKMFPKAIGTVLEENYRAAMEKREIRRFEVFGQYVDAWYINTVYPSATGITIVATDITERKRAEEALHQSEERYHMLFDSMSEMFGLLEAVYDVNGSITDFRYLDVNPAAEQVVRLSREKIVGNRIRELFPRPSPIIREAMVKAVETGIRSDLEFYSLAVDQWQKTHIWSPGKGLVATLSTDITERRRAEEALRLSEERFRFSLANSPVVVASLDKDLRYTWIYNPALDFKPEAIIGKTVGIATDPETTKQTRQRLTSVVTDGVSATWEMELRMDTGSHFFETRAEPLRDPLGEITGVAMLSIDITERKQTENQLREYDKQLQAINQSLEKQVQEKTVEVRKLALNVTNAVQRERYRLSHILHDDLQQRIYAIQMQLSFLRSELKKYGEQEQKEALEIETQLLEVLEITRHLSIEMSPPILREEGLTQAISWLANQMLQRYGLPIEIQADESFAIQDEDLHVFLFSCVREMLFNTVKHAEATHAIVVLRWVDNCIEIKVQDNGKGFPASRSDEQSEEEKTDPSLGIPTIRQQVSLFGGTLDIQSAPETGTSILITVPIPERS
jgi:PAS domain S-box-containing protein